MDVFLAKTTLRMFIGFKFVFIPLCHWIYNSTFELFVQIIAIGSAEFDQAAINMLASEYLSLDLPFGLVFLFICANITFNLVNCYFIQS